MNTNEVMQEMTKSYINLSDMQKDEFSRILNKLLSVNYICGERKKDRDDFYFILRNEQLFKNFLLILDYQFHLYKADQIAYITNTNNYNHLTLTQLQSIVLLLLRKLYFQKTQEFQETENIVITLAELHAEIEATGIYNHRITKTELRSVYHFLSRYNICEKIGDLSEDESKLIIYPTINYILPISKIDDIVEQLKNYRREHDDEDIDESKID